MSLWIVEPRDPLLLRDGRPFQATPGARAYTLDFPYPSTLAGAVRTRAGRDEAGRFQDDVETIAAVKSIGIRGPLLVELANDDEGDQASGDRAKDARVTQEDDGKGGNNDKNSDQANVLFSKVKEWFVPAPQDALMVEGELRSDGREDIILRKLVPIDLPDSAYMNLPMIVDSGAVDQGTHINEAVRLYPVGLPEREPRKPSKQAKPYWRWRFFYEYWLKNDRPYFLISLYDYEEEENIPEDPHVSKIYIDDVGISGLRKEVRTHIAMDPTSKTADAESGALFQTEGLVFQTMIRMIIQTAGQTLNKKPIADHASPAMVGHVEKRFALALDIQSEVRANGEKYDLVPGVAPFGGERRIVFWRETTDHFPEAEESFLRTLAKERRARLILLTPAYFLKGWYPTWLLQKRDGVQPNLVGAALSRYVTVSGWDFEMQKPKKTRRLVPAGTVYFLHLIGEEEAVYQWLKSIWMSNVSDEDADRRDGFGLAVLGVWNEGVKKLEVRV